MQMVADIAESEERQGCHAMGKSQRDLEAEISRLEELKACRQSYADKSPPTNGVSKIRWQDYQNFLKRLDHAVGAQEQMVKNGRQNREAHRQRWLVKKQRLDSLERVVDRFRKAENAEVERQSQRMMDDLPNNNGDFEEQ